MGRKLGENKYQYLATVYSKERSIYTSSRGNMEPYLQPQPWHMQCDRFQTTCTIALTRRKCEVVGGGWEKKCPEYYGDE